MDVLYIIDTAYGLEKLCYIYKVVKENNYSPIYAMYYCDHFHTSSENITKHFFN